MDGAGDAPDEVKLAAFRDTLHQLRRRIEAFVNLPDAALDRLSLEQSARRLADA